MISAQQALERLQEGNRRFVAGQPDNAQSRSPARRAALAGGQAPFACIVGCSDSRVPLELVFDQGLGDLFVIRVAGNIVLDSEMGSVEFTVAEFDTPLVVVLGHSNCGAVTGAVRALEQPLDGMPAALRSIVEQVKPAVDDVIAAGGGDDRARLIDEAVRTNVRNSVQQLCRGSELLGPRVEEGRLRIVGAEYMLENGTVEFFDTTPAEV